MPKAEYRLLRTIDSKRNLLVIAFLFTFSFFGIGLLNASDGWAKDVTLEWDPNLEPDLGGYIVHYGTESGIYDHNLDVGNFTSAVISGLDSSKEYYFAVSAYNLDGLSSGLSNEVTTALVPSSEYVAGANSGGGSGCFINAAQEVSGEKNSNVLLRKLKFIWQGIEEAAQSIIN
jgi:hypothetical protein